MAEIHKTKWSWEKSNSCKIRSYIGILIYMGLVDLKIKDYFLDDVSHRQAITLIRFQKYVHLKIENSKPKTVGHS